MALIKLEGEAGGMNFSFEHGINGEKTVTAIPVANPTKSEDWKNWIVPGALVFGAVFLMR